MKPPILLPELFHFVTVIWACRYGVHPLSAMKGIFVQAPVFISFFLAVRSLS